MHHRKSLLRADPGAPGRGPRLAQAILPREVRERILQAVVEVRPYDIAGTPLRRHRGSGTIISADGYVLTNFHVVGDVDTGFAHEWHGIYVTDPGARPRARAFAYWARFVAGDPRHDLAIVQIVEDAEERPLPAGFVFPSMPVGDSNTLIPAIRSPWSATPASRAARSPSPRASSRASSARTSRRRQAVDQDRREAGARQLRRRRLRRERPAGRHPHAAGADPDGATSSSRTTCGRSPRLAAAHRPRRQRQPLGGVGSQVASVVPTPPTRGAGPSRPPGAADAGRAGRRPRATRWRPHDDGRRTSSSAAPWAR
jgi:hypothetical protein